MGAPLFGCEGEVFVTNPRSRTLEALLGAIVLCTALAFFGFVYVKSDQSVPNSYVLKACFDRVDGLSVGSDVRMAGVKIGKVRDIHLDPRSFLAIVLFDIFPPLGVPRDSMAQIISGSLLGGRFLSITPGMEEVVLKPGDEIIQTQSPVNIESLISRFVFNPPSGAKS